jgi:hypothetical protein
VRDSCAYFALIRKNAGMSVVCHARAYARACVVRAGAPWQLTPTVTSYKRPSD